MYVLKVIGKHSSSIPEQTNEFLVKFGLDLVELHDVTRSLNKPKPIKFHHEEACDQHKYIDCNCSSKLPQRITQHFASFARDCRILCRPNHSLAWRSSTLVQEKLEVKQMFVDVLLHLWSKSHYNTTRGLCVTRNGRLSFVGIDIKDKQCYKHRWM